jgi:16S rRNA processing protein RimM
LAAGRVGRAHGLDGSFYVTRPRARMLLEGAAVEVAGSTREIVRRAGTDAHPIVRLDGVEDRSGAEALRGQQLTVPAEQAPQLQEGEWWAHELVGCSVIDGARTVGTVARLLEMPSCEVLEVTPAEGGEPLLVPMVADAIRSVQPQRGRIEIDVSFLGLDDDPGRR